MFSYFTPQAPWGMVLHTYILNQKVHTMPFRILSDDDISRIKRNIWNGDKQGSVAREYDVSQPHINRIVNGHTGYHISWPDGNIGGLSHDKKVEIIKDRKLSDIGRMNDTSYNESLQDKENRKMIDDYLKGKAERDDREFWNKMKSKWKDEKPSESSKGAPSPEKIKPILSPIPWGIVMEKYGKHPFVMETEEGDDARMMALGHMAKDFPDSGDWSEGILSSLIDMASSSLNREGVD